jgi:branched-chain amino acid aminotransferase
MKISVIRSHYRKPLPPVSELGFGKHFSDHMFLMEHGGERGWHSARVEPYQTFALDPANLTLHYGQTIFEGLKAFRWSDGSVHLFRPLDHIERFNRSAERLCQPTFAPEILLEGFKALLGVDHRWVPAKRGTALYIRPTMIAGENALGVRPSSHYLLYVITSPVGNYYAKGTAPTRILVEERYSRTAVGGLGEVKTAANYAASLLAAEEAKQRGYDQVLWLDSQERRYAEEVGTMNIFFVIDGVLVTPSLTGTILNGITRRTVMTLAAEWGIPFEERPVAMKELVDAYEKGTLQEVFGSGTAAVIAPVGELFYQGKSILVPERADSICDRLFRTITGIQYGEIPDTHGWMTAVPDTTENDRTGEWRDLVSETRIRFPGRTIVPGAGEGS